MPIIELINKFYFKKSGNYLIGEPRVGEILSNEE